MGRAVDLSLIVAWLREHSQSPKTAQHPNTTATVPDQGTSSAASAPEEPEAWTEATFIPDDPLLQHLFLSLFPNSCESEHCAGRRYEMLAQEWSELILELWCSVDTDGETGPAAWGDAEFDGLTDAATATATAAGGSCGSADQAVTDGLATAASNDASAVELRRDARGCFITSADCGRAERGDVEFGGLTDTATATATAPAAGGSGGSADQTTADGLATAASGGADDVKLRRDARGRFITSADCGRAERGDVEFGGLTDTTATTTAGGSGGRADQTAADGLAAAAGSGASGGKLRRDARGRFITSANRKTGKNASRSRKRAWN